MKINKPAGRPKGSGLKHIDYKLLDALIVWASQEYCAEQLGMSVSLLERKLKAHTGMIFSEYKKKRQEPMRINLLKKQYDVAMNGNVSMLIWLGKNHLGQRDSFPDEKLKFTKEDGRLIIHFDDEKK